MRFWGITPVEILWISVVAAGVRLARFLHFSPFLYLPTYWHPLTSPVTSPLPSPRPTIMYTRCPPGGKNLRSPSIFHLTRMRGRCRFTLTGGNRDGITG